MFTGDNNALHELASDGTTWLAGADPGTAIRVAVEGCAKGGCAHLDQMAYSPTLGWYRQRRFTVPREMIGELARSLRMCDCVMERPQTRAADRCSGQAPETPGTNSPVSATGEDLGCDACEPAADPADAGEPIPFQAAARGSDHPRQRSG
jgi:hypothetical protein